MSINLKYVRGNKNNGSLMIIVESYHQTTRSTEFDLSMWIEVRRTYNIRHPGQLVRGAPEIAPIIFRASGWVSKPEEQFRMEVGHVRAEPGVRTKGRQFKVLGYDRTVVSHSQYKSKMHHHEAKLLCSDMQLPGDGDVEA
ncbi:predicted protein [Histoplasma capsulatum var. duboisii H88]|uniref:Predicted protein n=2 Tax=Ajellomyces capsulatus TaxID=5037 RepID=F0U4P7_AJEC8|nr:predicted protein [Histoplasma capsulatum H143]EGC41994.1 predicted protein [Histoplasma capsulatum var. duboisii H88]